MGHSVALRGLAAAARTPTSASTWTGSACWQPTWIGASDQAPRSAARPNTSPSSSAGANFPLVGSTTTARGVVRARLAVASPGLARGWPVAGGGCRFPGSTPRAARRLGARIHEGALVGVADIPRGGARQDQVARSLGVLRSDGDAERPPSESPTTAARSIPTASITATGVVSPRSFHQLARRRSGCHDL